MSESGRPRLLVLTSTYPRWAGDHEPGFVHELARRLVDHFEVSVLAPHAPGSAEAETLDGIDVRRFRYAPEVLEKLAYAGGIPANLKRRPWLMLLVPWFLTAQLLATYRMVRRLRPAVVHAHWLFPSGLVGALARELPGCRFRFVVTAHGADVHVTGGLLGSFLKREILDSADQVTVVSKALHDLLRRELPTADIAIAPMGVDLQHRFVPATSATGDPVLVFVGRLVEKKGLADLLNAMPTIIAQVANARLLIVGDGPLKAGLQRLTQDLLLDDAVRFLGSVANECLPEVLHSARIAVFPFRIADNGDQEGLGLVMVEAMGCGLPVVASDLPGVRDVIEDGVTGRLTPPGDRDSLAAAVIDLLADGDQAMQLGSRARDSVVERFDWATVGAGYADLLLNPLDK
jgi:glycosyltransferase involved in cell wall biosynthesis